MIYFPLNRVLGLFGIYKRLLVRNYHIDAFNMIVSAWKKSYSLQSSRPFDYN